MLFLKSISIAKKFFHNTLRCFKSFLPGRYQRLPNTPNFVGYTYSFNQSHRESCVCDHQDKAKIKRQKEKTMSMEQMPMIKEDIYDGSFMKFVKQSRQDQEIEVEIERKMRRSHQEGERKGRSFMVVQKLRELEMMDVSNVDHVLDIEEVLHYYSRLTCPIYLDIVDRFFMEVYSEFFLQ